MRIKFKKLHQQQQDESDCGIICLKIILNYFKSNLSLELLREYSGTTKSGTTMLGLLQCAQKIGLEAKGFEATIDNLKENNKIAILHTVLDENTQHYIVCYGYNKIKNLFIISNPSVTRVEAISSEDLNKIWRSKALLIFDETPRLVKIKIVKQNKIKWLLNYLKEDTNILLTSLILGVIIAGLSLATAIYSQKLIDILLPSNDVLKIVSSLILLLFLFLLNTFFNYLRGLFLIRQSKDFNIRIIDYFYSSLLKLPKAFFDTRRIGDMVARMNDTSRIQKTISKIFSSIIIDLLLIIISSIAIYSYDKYLGFVTLIWIPIFTILVLYFNPKIIKKQRLVMQSYAKNESNYIDTIRGVETIKGNNKEKIYSNYTKSIYGYFQNSIFSLSKLGLLYNFLNQIISNIFIITILGFSIYLVLNGEISSGVIIALLQLVGILMKSTSNLAMVNIEIQEAKIAFNRMFEFATIKKEAQGEITINNFESLMLENVSFRFSGRDQLLKNINVEIKKGQFISIVGESGSGKSTLGQILQKFYIQENGAITINDSISLNDVQLSSWRSLIAVIPQDINIFNGTVVDNLLLGNEDSPEQVIQFCKEYGFEKFITQLPQGYGTIIGEEGVNLSGGQKQIIAFARALYRRPHFLILDEATSAMDRNTEKFTMDLLSKLKNNIAVLFISHRLQTLKNISDTIYVLENGTIVIKGNHQKLLQSKNFYSDFFDSIIN